MTYTVSVAANKDYIAVRVKVPMNLQLASQIARELTATGAASNLNRFLYDVRESRNIDSDATNYFFAYEEMEKLQLDKQARVAILTSPEDTSHDFLATVCRNAGYNVRLFTGEKAALDWLLAS